MSPFTQAEEEAAKKVCPNCKDSKYSFVYSDEEDNEEEASSDEESNESADEDFSFGIDQYIATVILFIIVYRGNYSTTMSHYFRFFDRFK